MAVSWISHPVRIWIKAENQAFVLATTACSSMKDATYRSGDLNENIAVGSDIGARLWKRNRASLGDTTQDAKRQGEEGEKLHDCCGLKKEHRRGWACYGSYICVRGKIYASGNHLR